MNNDLISREALKEIRFASNKIIQIGGRTNGKTLESISTAYQMGWNDAIDAIINNAPTVPLPDFKEGYKQAIIDGKTNFSRPHGEWVPVSERLPEVGQIVIVTDDRGKVFEYELNPSNVDKYTTGKWQFLEHEIIAWQPLPKPYEEAEK